MQIYVIRNKTNGKCYVGQTIKSLRRRKAQHKYELINNKHHNEYLQNAWNKYGEEAFEFEVLEECDSIDELNEKEVDWVEKLDSMYDKDGYNFDVGGDNYERPKSISDYTRKQRSIPVEQFNPEGEKIAEYRSAREARRQTGITNINKVCIGKAETAGGYKWKKNENLKSKYF